MPLRHITLRQLKVFEAVARHLSFSRAAAELHLTQPAVSMQVKSLEEQAGLPLFEQVGKKIHLTEAGAEVARFALEVHSGLKDCEDTLAAIRGVSGGRLHLAVVSTAKYFAPRLLAEFSRRHPGVTVKLSVTNREQVIGELQANQVDLAIMGRPPRGLDVEATAFAKHPHGIIAAPEHPLASRRGLPSSTVKRRGSPSFQASAASEKMAPFRLKLPSGTGPTSPSCEMNGKRSSVLTSTNREPTTSKSGQPRSVEKPPMRNACGSLPQLPAPITRVANV